MQKNYVQENEKKLRETCIIRVFEILRYQTLKHTSVFHIVSYQKAKCIQILLCRKTKRKRKKHVSSFARVRNQIAKTHENNSIWKYKTTLRYQKRVFECF